MPSIATRAIKYSLILTPTCQSFVFVLAPPRRRRLGADPSGTPVYRRRRHPAATTSGGSTLILFDVHLSVADLPPAATAATDARAPVTSGAPVCRPPPQPS